MVHISQLPNKKVVLGTGNLSIEDVVGVSRYAWPVAEIGEYTSDPNALEAYKRIKSSRDWVKGVVENDSVVSYYGINTGFGSKAGREPLPKSDIPWVSRNLIVSHSTGVGKFLHPEIVRAAMLIRANSLAQGYSGVREELINTLVKMLNEGVCPAIPEYGSVGASGDLAPLSHLALVISRRPSQNDNREGFSLNYKESSYAYLAKTDDDDMETALATDNFGLHVEYAFLDGHAAMQKRGIEPLELEAKEGLAFNNGATFSAAIGTLALFDSENILRHAEISTAMSTEALLGFRDAFLPHIQQVRRHTGQIETAQRIMKFMENSTLADGDATQKPRMVPPQDAYSIRVTPQVIGAVWDTLSFIRHTLHNEINAATDNPLVFDLPEEDPLNLPRPYRIVSGGNFHGAPIAYAMDFLGIVMTDLGSLCERRIFRLTDRGLNQGLPAMLIEEERNGLTSGMMISQYLAASLVSDCKTLSHPDSVDSIPTSANQEDHVSMSMNAARHARQIVENVTYVVAIELLCAAIGLDWRIRDIEMKVKNREFLEEVEQKKESKRTRVDEKVLYLSMEGLNIILGKGSRLAVEAVEEKLYSSQDPLPELGKKPATEDRYLRPYVLRAFELLQSGELLKKVYKGCEITTD